MLQYVLSDIRKTPERIYPKWRQYIDFHAKQIQYLKNRYLRNHYISYESRGIQLLRHILSFMDIAHMNKFTNDFERYVRYLRFIQNDLDNIFNPISTTLVKKGHFINKQHNDVDEYIIPVRAIDPFNVYPFDRKWIQWKDAKTVRVIDHDSSELNLFLSHHQVTFKSFIPSYLTLTIDPCMLCLQYYNYLKDCEDEDKGQVAFLHKYVLNHFFEDILDIWIIKQLHIVLTTENENDLKIQLGNYDLYYGKLGSRYIEAMVSLHREFNNLKNGNLNPNSILHSHLLYGGSIYDKMRLFSDVLSIHDLRQYKFLEYLKDISLFSLFFEVYYAGALSFKSKNVFNKLDYQFKRIEDSRIWNTIRNTTARFMFESNIKSIRTKLFMLK